MRCPSRLLVAVLVLVLGAEAHAAEVRRFRGYAFDLDSDRYLYTEVHEQTWDNGRWTAGRIRYYQPDGSLLGDKQLDFRANPSVPVFRFEMAPQQYLESITAVQGGDVALRKVVSGKVRQQTLALDADTAADSGFHNYLLDRFDALLGGQTLAFRFIVAGNLDAYRFRARRVGETAFDGRTAVRLRVEPDSMLRYLVDPLELLYDARTRELLEYRGISNVHDPATRKAYTARIVYTREPPAGAPARLPPLEP